MGRQMRFWYLSHCPATKAQTSLHKCTDSPEPTLLACTEYRYSLRLRPTFKPLAWLDTSALMFKGDFCVPKSQVLAQNSCLSFKLLQNLFS